MRKSRVGLACGLVVIVIVFSLGLSAFIFTSGQYMPKTSDYSDYELAVHPPISDYVYPLANYSLVRSGTIIELFDRVGVAKFESGIEFYQGVTNISHTDSFGYFEIHETPSTVVEFEACQDNGMIFELAEGTGAIRNGDAIIVGSQDASGEFVMIGAATAAIGDGKVLFDVPTGSRVIFRADPSQDYAVGGAIAGGHVAAEMYLIDAISFIGEDVVSFDDVELYTVMASEEAVQIQAVGTANNKAIVLHINQPYLDYDSVEDIEVQLDGEEITLGMGMTETLTESGEEAVYFASKTDAGFDVIVYIPEYSDSVITIASVETDIGIDGFATLLAAIGIVGVAVVALIKTD
ncbi:MAG: hypothetical protein KAR56_04160 [Thermoplasmata archaeon]|nr:hypothetical protein [Thermoplasmata archaeon]